MAKLTKSNKSFQRAIGTIRKIMPFLAFGLLIVVYVVSAIAGGMFLAKLMKSLSGGIILAYSIGAAIQATRGTLVFFPQLNPTRPNLSYWGEGIAVTMGLLSIIEILFLVKAAGLATPVAVSLSILMAAGIGIELFLLKEIRFVTEIELFSDKQHWKKLQDFYRARRDFQNFMDNLEDEDEQGLGNGQQDSNPKENGEMMPAIP